MSYALGRYSREKRGRARRITARSGRRHRRLSSTMRSVGQPEYGGRKNASRRKGRERGCGSRGKKVHYYLDRDFRAGSRGKGVMERLGSGRELLQEISNPTRRKGGERGAT